MPESSRHQPLPHGRDRQGAADALISTVPLLNRLIERLLANLSPALTPTQFLTLRAIDAGVRSGSDLARLAGVSAPAVSQLVAALTASGLIARAEMVEDRRRQTLRLSDRGRDVLAQVQGTLRAEIAPLVAALPPPEVDALARALETIDATLSGMTPPRRPHRPPPPPPPPHHPPDGHRITHQP